MATKIEWATETWNPVIGCGQEFNGCENCYAMNTARRLSKIETTKYYENVIDDCGRWNGKTMLVPDQLTKPLKRKKPTIYLLCSMSDLFYDLQLDWMEKIFSVIAECPQHRFLILTKYPKRALDDLDYLLLDEGFTHVGIGVSVEDQKSADERIKTLLNIPASMHFVSCGPLIGPVEIPFHFEGFECHHGVREQAAEDLCSCCDPEDCHISDQQPQIRYTIDWLIVEGESGKYSRPMHPEWVRNLRNQANERNVPFFFKSWGAWKTLWEETRDSKESKPMISIFRGNYPMAFDGLKTLGEAHIPGHDAIVRQSSKLHTGRLLDGREWNEYPSWFGDMK